MRRSDRRRSVLFSVTLSTIPKDNHGCGGPSKLLKGEDRVSARRFWKPRACGVYPGRLPTSTCECHHLADCRARTNDQIGFAREYSPILTWRIAIANKAMTGVRSLARTTK